ncbi:MAG: hypothetical protein ACI4P6_03870 [Candidatus Spyradosoma sp.]
MKKFLTVSLLAAVAALSGCVSTTVDVPEEKFRSEAKWTGRTLENVRYYGVSAEEIREAAIKAIRSLDLYYAGDTPGRSGYELYACGPRFTKITIDVTLRAPKAGKNDLETPPQYVEVAVVYGTMGDKEKSRELVSLITKNLGR